MSIPDIFYLLNTDIITTTQKYFEFAGKGKQRKGSKSKISILDILESKEGSGVGVLKNVKIEKVPAIFQS
jgi:hypothetical protein